VTEKRNSIGTPHFERVFELLTAGLMAGLPLQTICEEDVRMGWLLPEGQPRVPMLFLVGQTQPLPEPVQRHLRRYRAAGGRIFTDADSGEQPGAERLELHTHALRSLYHEGYAADTIYPLFAPVQERLAGELRAAVGALRRHQVDSDNPWVAPNLFDGGAILYVMLSTDEGAPLPFAPGAFWELGELYRFSMRPQRATVTCGERRAVVYDVFERRLVQPAPGPVRLEADLGLFPAALFALAPEPVGAPRLETGRDADERLHYRVSARTAAGRSLAARVPLRLRLLRGGVPLLELFRGTGASGLFEDSLTLPATSDALAFEVTELLGGQAVTVALAPAPLPAGTPLSEERLSVDLLPEERLSTLLELARAQGGIHLWQGTTEAPHASRLAAALAAAGLTVESSAGEPGDDAVPGVHLLLAGVAGNGQPGGKLPLECWRRGLLPLTVTAHNPGPERGLVTGVLAPRARDEHVILLLGGDDAGLAHAVARFADWLAARPTDSAAPAAPRPPPLRRAGAPGGTDPLPPLSTQVGVRLAEVHPAAAGGRLLVTARGHHRNLLLLEDAGNEPRVVRAVRAGQASQLGPAWISPDGRHFGATCRSTTQARQGFQLCDDQPATEPWLFASFGDFGRTRSRFAVSADARTVVAPGPYGVVCWQRDATGWREAWALEHWRRFTELDWPVSADSERNPQFHALIPDGGDAVLVLHGERTNQGWITPANPAAVHLSAHALADGAERWRFAVPVAGKLLFPTLYSSADGRRLLLQVQVGSWGKETYRFYVLEDGKVSGQWEAGTGMAPTACALDAGSGRIALAYKGRRVEVRQPDAALLASLSWRGQPVGVAFAPGGERFYVADDAGTLTSLEADGRTIWRAALGSVCEVAATERSVYAAGWDGRLRAYAPDGKPRWTFDCTPHLRDAEPLASVHAAGALAQARIIAPRRASTAAVTVPAGENLLAGSAPGEREVTGADGKPGKAKGVGNARAFLRIGGTGGWMSNGALQVQAEQLANGQLDDVTEPWLHLDELFWNATAGRQVWAEIMFSAPTHVRAVTVYEHPQHPENWPTEALVEVWDEKLQRWETAAFGLFLEGPVNSYTIDREAVTRLRYVPWASYYRNFRTCEIEVR
jgi:hypothetical protein